MLGDGNLVAFCPTRDGQRARHFYEGVLGLRVVSDDDFAVVVDAHGTTLRIQKVAEFTPHPFTTLGWEVGDVDATVRALRARGVAFETFAGMGQDALGVWKAPGGARVAWFKDPDGNLLSLTQLPFSA